VEQRNVLTIENLAIRAAPWLATEELTSAFDCATLITESAGETLPFWAPFAGVVSPLIELKEWPDDRPNLHYDQDPSSWVARFVVLPALQQNLKELPSVALADEVAADRFAEEVLRVAHDDRLRYRVCIHLSGIDLDSGEDDALAEDDVCIRRLSNIEQAAWFDGLEGRSGWPLLDSQPPLIAIEQCAAGPRDAQHMPEDSIMPLMVTALELHRHHPAGRYGVQYSDPIWVSPSFYQFPLVLPGRSTKQSMLTADGLRQTVSTAKSLKDYDLKQPQSSKDLALHRFIAGMARNDITDAVLDFTIALEALLLPYDEDARRSDLGYRFRIHGAHYLADNPADRRAVAKRLTDIYETRSRLVHGGNYPDRTRISAIRDTAEEFVCSGLLRAVHKGFPTANAFKKMILGLPSE
jgi:Apea-like HEPN